MREINNKAMDKILMKQLSFYGYHGVLSQEKELGQKFIVDVEIGCELLEAGLTDDLKNTVSYAEIYQEIKQIMEGDPYNLIEACAQAIADRILTHSKVSWCLVRISKPEAPIPGIFDTVGVEILRYKTDD